MRKNSTDIIIYIIGIIIGALSLDIWKAKTRIKKRLIELS